MGFRVLKGGMLTTVQDLGRTGYQSQGFSVSGVMDVRSFKIANLLLDNPENEAVLEFTLMGPSLEFTSETIIAITGGDYRFTTQFLYTSTALNEIKPKMIEEATENARIAGEKFAHDSKSKLGKIKFANQGQFSISDRDANTPYIKTVRVVTSVDYYLKD